MQIIRACEDSLRRLDTDYIDLYQTHWPDHGMPYEEVLGVLSELRDDGKVRVVGASNETCWGMMKACWAADVYDVDRYETVQNNFSLINRRCESELAQVCRREQVSLLPYSPLGGGLLTGKYGTSKKPDEGRLTDNPMYQKRYGQQWVYQVAEDFTQFAREQGFEPAALAVAWVGSHPAVTAPIIGARNLEQLDGSLKALEIDMTAELYAQVSALSPTPPPATDRLEEQG